MPLNSVTLPRDLRWRVKRGAKLLRGGGRLENAGVSYLICIIYPKREEGKKRTLTLKKWRCSNEPFLEKDCQRRERVETKP